MLPQVYKNDTDEKENVTQEWCDNAQKAMNKLAKQLQICNAVSKLSLQKDYEKIDKIYNFLYEL